MSPSASSSSGPVALVGGDDEFAVKQRARQVYQQWCAELGGMDHEIIDASVAHSGEALAALARLREALQTLPFFGSAKVIWFQNCNFLGDERTAGAQAVAESLANLAEELKAFPWDNVRLLISAGKIDKRRGFYKAMEKLGGVELFTAWSPEDRDWTNEAESLARRQLRALKKQISDEALARLVTNVGPNPRQLAGEVEKLALYVGGRVQIETQDVAAIVTRHKQSRAFALGDALGARDLPRVLRALDEELWGLKTDSQKSGIGLLYGLISKVRVLIFLKEMIREGWIKADVEYARFKAQLERVPPELLPEDRRFNPLAMHPYMLFNALPHAKRYRLAELVRAMEALLECNQRLISSGLDEALILQQTLVRIVRDEAEPAPNLRAE